ncbi:MAG: hypothetical protein K0R90_1791 [Oscillospiraceae bacterium]|nr:hypothetical protein [Oscillospiraceae bacterium]
MVILLLVLGILFFAVVSCLMTYGVHRYKQANDQTVVVLGCKVNGEIPSRMLTRRLETAYELLVNNPELKCVVTGGQGEDEVCTEASVMQKFLAEKGIAQERIFFEDQAINTKENFQKTAEIIDKNHLNTSIIIVTDFFHQYRSQFYANKFALESTSVSCSTQPDLFLCYWVREVLAVAKAFVGM